MFVIGLLGGVASGKSLVADELRRLGAKIIDADDIGHHVLREPEVIAALRQRWGEEVIGRDGQVVRAAVAKIVFAPPPQGPVELAFLEELTHPRIGARLERALDSLSENGNLKAVVLDAPVMLKAGWDDQILFIEAPPSTRLQRARRRGWTDADFTAREEAQEPLDVKRKAADRVIDNSGAPEIAYGQVQRFWQSLE